MTAVRFPHPSLKEVTSMNREEAFATLDRIAKGIAEMFGSNCETIIHDLADPHHPILAIYNGHVSGRSVGSTLDVTGLEENLYLEEDVVNLLAVTPTGQQTKSATFSIKGDDYHLGFGINYDFTPLTYHSAIYKTRETGIGDLLDEAILRVGKPAREMNKNDRLRVIEYLKEVDAFSYRRAVPFVASQLGVSRYTIYKYLDEIKENNENKEASS